MSVERGSVYYKKLRNHYRKQSNEPTAKQIAPVLGSSVSYAKKCLATGSFTVADKYRILHDLRVDPEMAVDVFPPLGE